MIFYSINHGISHLWFSLECLKNRVFKFNIFIIKIWLDILFVFQVWDSLLFHYWTRLFMLHLQNRLLLSDVHFLECMAPFTGHFVADNVILTKFFNIDIISPIFDQNSILWIQFSMNSFAPTLINAFRTMYKWNIHFLPFLSIRVSVDEVS